jgi:pyruvate dehydrogenase E2 component (dihydrolipoamide acetyltransferase)
MDAAIALRGGLKASANGEAVPSLNDLIVKACAIALRQHPRANGSYADGGFELHGRINIGVAVAGEDALVVPVVLDADTKSLGGIAR